MLVEFRFGNFRSFKDEAVLSMLAAPQLDGDAELDEKNVFAVPERPKLRLLRTAGIYGANASGKSNLLFAMEVFREIVIQSAYNDYTLPDPRFQLHTQSPDALYSFEIVFILEGRQYRYGFEVGNSLNTKSLCIAGEWLFVAESVREKTLFERAGNQVVRGRSFHEGSAILKNGAIGRDETLFLSMSAQVASSESISGKLLHYIINLGVLSVLDEARKRAFTEQQLQIPEARQAILTALKIADVGIRDIYFEPVSESSPPTIVSYHPVYNEAGSEDRIHRAPISHFESQGTQKFLHLLSCIYFLLQTGGVCFVDELEAELHPLLTRTIINTFQSSEANPKNAQLIFVTHDINLLTKKLFRRDQIWFIEKDSYEASHLYSLSDIKPSKSSERRSYEENYITGRYGGIPFLGNATSLFEAENEEEESHVEI